MKAIVDQYSTQQAVVMMLQAGVDILLMPEDLPLAVSAIEQAIQNGEILESDIDQSVLRILTVKQKYDILS